VPGSGRDGQCPHRVPGAGEVGGPGPVPAEVEPAFPLTAGKAGGYVQEPEPQQLGGRVPQFAGWQGEVAKGREEVRGHCDDLGRRDVDRPVPRRPPAQP